MLFGGIAFAFGAPQCGHCLAVSLISLLHSAHLTMAMPLSMSKLNPLA
jgi:hypothetical protein